MAAVAAVPEVPAAVGVVSEEAPVMVREDSAECTEVPTEAPAVPWVECTITGTDPLRPQWAAAGTTGPIVPIAAVAAAVP